MYIFMSYFNVIILKYFIRLLLNLCPGPTRAKGLKSGGENFLLKFWRGLGHFYPQNRHHKHINPHPRKRGKMLRRNLNLSKNGEA